MDIGAVSQGIMDVAATGVNVVPDTNSGDGSFFFNVEKALSTMNTVSLKDEQEAIDLSGFSGVVTSLIMSFYANGGNVVELQDAQKMADIILGSDAMLDLLSYEEVTLNDIFLSNLNGGVLNGSESLGDKINGTDFSELIGKIKQEIATDFDLGKDMSELISQVLDEIQSGLKNNAVSTKLSEQNAVLDAVNSFKTEGTALKPELAPVIESNVKQEAGKENLETAKTEIDAVLYEDERQNNQQTVVKGQEDRIRTATKTDYKSEVKDRTATKITHTVVTKTVTEGIGTLLTKVETAEIALERPIESAGLANSVLELMQTSVNNGNNNLFIRLKPDFLGGLAIKLSMSENGVVARIVTNSERTQSMLASQMINLEASLKEKGIDVARMEILYNPMNQDGQGQNSSRGQNTQGNEQNGSRRIVIGETDDEDINLQYLQLIGEDEELEGEVYNA